MVCTQEELRSSKYDEKELRVLAEQIYDLDTKVYQCLGSSLGRVFTKDRERCVDELVWELLARNQGHIVRSDLALISNMARTVRDDQTKKELMRESSRLNDIAMERLVPWVAKGLTEKELNAKIREIYKELGCEDVSFDPITAYAKGAADPHHVTDDSKGKRGDCVILDIGAFKDNYASDMTRTVFIGEVSDRAKEIYDIVVEANRRGIEAAKPGNRMCDVDLAARNYIEEKGYGQYFTHRTGHSIGLEDHEFGDVSSVNEDIIQVGQCFSVEPGIYLADEGIGVRIEDLVIITEDGCEVLNHYTKDLIVVPEE